MDLAAENRFTSAGVRHVETWWQAWPQWVEILLASAATFAGAYIAGRLIKGVVTRRLRQLAQSTHTQWDDLLLAELAPRLPRWGLLLAVYVVAGFWPLPDNLRWVLEHAVFILAAASVTFFAAGVAMRLVASYGSTFQSALPVTSLTQNLTWLLVMILGGLVALNGLGVSIAPMLTALGIGGLAVALALQDPLSNLFAGLVVTLERQLRVGDDVKLDNGLEGCVVDFSWRSTRLRTPTNSLVLVPNAKIAQSIIINHHLPDRRVDVPVELDVPYVSDLALLERVTCQVGRDVMADVEGGFSAFEPSVRYHSVSDSHARFTVTLSAREHRDLAVVKHEFLKRLRSGYEAAGVLPATAARALRVPGARPWP
jgi:small-conductance mechanosensitive channel